MPQSEQPAKIAAQADRGRYAATRVRHVIEATQGASAYPPVAVPANAE